MTTETFELTPEIQARIDEAVAARFNQLLRDEVDALTSARAVPQEEKHQRRLAIVASKGTLDMAYPPLILASTAAAMGWQVSIFFTFYGLDIVNKKKNRSLQVAPLANPAMPVPVPNIIGAIPGMTAMATWMMKGWMKNANMPTLQEMIDICRESGVQLVPCSTTMGVMKTSQDDLLDGLECGGAAGFLDFAAGADVTIFV